MRVSTFAESILQYFLVLVAGYMLGYIALRDKYSFVFNELLLRNSYELLDLTKMSNEYSLY